MIIFGGVLAIVTITLDIRVIQRVAYIANSFKKLNRLKFIICLTPHLKWIEFDAVPHIALILFLKLISGSNQVGTSVLTNFNQFNNLSSEGLLLILIIENSD